MSKHTMTRWKYFITTDDDFSDWLNAYSAQGWQLSKAGWLRYHFTRGIPSQSTSTAST